jgi:hypothetical protein
MVWAFGSSPETGTTGPTVIPACLISTCSVTAGMIELSYAFDLVELDGNDLRRESIENRKAALVKLLRKADYGIFLNEHVEDEAAIVFQHACKLGLEGIVSKAPRIAIPVWAFTGLAEDQKSKQRSRQA